MTVEDCNVSSLQKAIKDLVTANHIVAAEGVCDTFGHVTMRHPDRADRYLMSCSRAPELVSAEDIIEFDLDSNPFGDNERLLYGERPIHGEIYKARPDVHAIVHNHAHEIIPFGVTNTPVKALLHVAAIIGQEVPIWDIRDHFGDTDLLVTSQDRAESLAAALGDRPSILMRGHGCVTVGPTIVHAVAVAIYLMVNARLQEKAAAMGEVKYLSPGEIEAASKIMGHPIAVARVWEHLSRRAEKASI